MLIIFIFIFIIYAPIQIVYSSDFSSSQFDIKNGGYALHALQRLLNFFESDANNLNLDGLYGLRIAQGQLSVLQQNLRSRINKKIYLTDRNNIINSLLTQMERIANVSLQRIAQEASSYLHRFYLLVHHPFVIDYQSRKINKNLIEQDERNSNFDETESNQCFAELLGSSDGSNSIKCFVSERCWNMMTSPKEEDYRITHQLLWFLIAKNIGCIHQEAANKKFNDLEDYFCANIYDDAKTNLHNNFNQDLFIEQVLLCSMIGYEDFLRLDWFNTILTWQHPVFGCFSGASETIRFHRIIQRRLLVEQQMNNGCLSHKSGLAAGLLGIYSRIFLQ
ncbi:unnamed protein product [Rotaria sp. Silwood2]|nr:unnamed protein product [Rotaria sp. Silwood2]CAF2928114.1 unnamed protein product [Rotaria sp. Silwood2]CAF3256539.1 unnamed protein product [Rotaria sp. Silwood2]CAF3305918.1 unnamed protein product [Rotaria sp. Silwood2]CAF4375835.1 unnamed protein product [Rotaria sp. Silwood2]